MTLSFPGVTEPICLPQLSGSRLLFYGGPSPTQAAISGVQSASRLLGRKLDSRRLATEDNEFAAVTVGHLPAGHGAIVTEETKTRKKPTKLHVLLSL